MPTHYESDNNKEMSQSDMLPQTAIWDLISAYADGEATAEETAQLEAMMVDNPFLAEDLAFLRRTSTVVRSLAEVDPPATLRHAIYARTTLRPTLARRMKLAWARFQTSFGMRPALRLTLAGGACLATGLTLTLLAPRTPVSHPSAQAPHATTPQIVAMAPPVIAEPHAAVKMPLVSQSETSRHDLVKSTPVRRHEATVSVGADRVRIALAAHPQLPAIYPTLHTAQLTSVAPTQPKKLVASLGPQSPRSVERHQGDEVESGYSHLPMMDLANQRAQLITAVARTASDTLGANIETSHDDATSVTETRADKQPADQRQKTIRVVLLSQLPPDARRYITAADIKRDMDARNLGFSRTTMEGIKREEATVAILGGKF